MNSDDVRAIYQMVPYALELGFEVVEAEPGRALCALPERNGLLNHLGTVHAGALFTFAESAAGAVVICSLDVTRYVPMVKDGRIDYRRLARGRLTADARLDLARAAEYAATAERDGKVFFPYEIEIKDAAGETCAVASFTYRLRKRE